MMTTLRPGGKPELLEPLTSKQEGTKVVLECRWADHSRISWFKNDIPVFSTKDVTLSQTRTSCTLTIHRASQTHNAEYKCVASNSLGKAIAQCRIDVLPAFAGRSPGRKLSSSLEKFNKVSNTGEQSKINLSPSTKPPLINGVSPHPVAPKKDNGARFPSTPPPAYQSTPPREPPSSQDRKVPSVRSNLQSTEPQSQSLQPKQSNQISQDDVKNFQTQSRVEPQTTQNRMEWRVKGPPPTFKPVSFEMVVPSHKAAAERDRTATPVQSTFVRPTFREPKEEATGLSEAGRLSPVVTKQVNAPGSKAAAVALLSNRLLAAQLKDNAFIAELRKEKSVATRPAPSKSITGSTPTGSTLTSSTPTSSTPTSSTPTASGPDSPSPRAVTPLSGRSATAGLRPMLGKSKSSDYSPPIKGLRPFSSVDIPSEPAYSLRKKGSTSSSSSLSDTDSTQRSTPPIKLSGVTSIKDRLARFSSSESLSSGSQSNTRRSNGELYKSSPSVAIGGIDALSRGAKLVSSESDHSRGSSIDGNQSHRSISPVGKSVVSEPSNKSAQNEKLRNFKEKLEGNSTPKSWRTNINNNYEKGVKDSSVEMKLKVSSFGSGLKSSPALRTTLPVFTSKLRNHYGRQGDALKLQCRVDGEPKPIISWMKEGKPVMENQRIKIYEHNGSHIFEVTNSLKEDSGRYTVKAVNSKGSSHCSADVEIAGRKTANIEEKTPKTFTSSFRKSSTDDKNRHNQATDISKQVDEFHSEANEIMADLDTLTPRSAASNGHATHSSHCSPPAFTLNLKDCAVEEGDSLDLECTTQGVDVGLDHSAPQFVKLLHDEVVEEGDSVIIQCKSSHEDDHGMKSRAPEFTQKLSDQEVTEGDSVTIEVHGSHDYHSAAAPRFVQELQDEVVEEGESVTIQCKSPHHASSTGAPVFVEKLHDLVAEEGSSLTLECQSPASKIAPHSQCSAPSFITKLEDHEVEEGDSVTIECQGPHDHSHGHSHRTEYSPQSPPDHHTADTTQSTSSNGISPPRFVKNLQDDEIEEGESLTISCTRPVSRSTPSQKPMFVQTLTNQEVEEGDSLLLSCKSKKSDPEHSLIQTQKPVFVQTLTNQEVEEGESLTLSCRNEKMEDTGLVSPPKFVKELQDEEIYEGKSLVIECSQLSPSTQPGTADSPLSLPSLPPSISKQLSDVSITVGHEAVLVMETTGSLPMDIVWVHNEDELNPDDPDYVQVSEGHTHSLIITAAFPEDSGTYICEAYNDFGEADTACELLVLDEVLEAEQPVDLVPKILEPLPETLKITDGSSVELVCRISNVSPEDVTWTKNDRMARKGSRFKTTGEEDKFSYIISDCMSIDRGTYTVTAATKHGEVSSTCIITYSSDYADVTSEPRQSHINPRLAPKFTKTLSDITVTETESAALECKVDATPTPTIQWLCGRKEVKPDNNYKMTFEAGLAKLTITEAHLADQGRYTVVAMNDTGSDKSSCFLNVHKPIEAPQGAPPDAPAGKPSIIDISAQGATVTWQGPSYDGGAPIEGYRVDMCKVSLFNISPTKYWKTLINLCKSTTYKVTQMATSNEYVFRVRAINAHGESPPGEMSDPVFATDRRESSRSISTIGDSESVDYSEYSDYPESEYDPDLDEAFLEHDVIITKDRKLEDHYEVVEELGKGKFGLVYLVTDKTTKRQWAAKKIKCRATQKKDIVNEIEIMNTLRHPKLVRLWEVFDNSREMVLIQEYVGGGELFERIVDDDFDLKESDCIRFIKQICDGIGYMHSKSIVHLDLKPENVMCVSKHSNQIKLIDFGLAKRFKHGDDMKIMFGTPEFVAPEVTSYDPVGFKTDMWSIGVITYVLLSGLSPFMGDNDGETLSNVTMAQWDFDDEAFDDISESSKEFISKLLIKRKENRLSAVDALEHPWLHDTSKPESGQTLSKSKSKMKTFLARRKWQIPKVAIHTIKRLKAEL